MITVADVVADQTLNLQVVTGGDHLDREVTSAHVSELTSPGDWLRGGELLMTVGLLLPMNPADCQTYLAERAGRSLSHRAGTRSRVALSGLPRTAANRCAAM